MAITLVGEDATGFGVTGAGFAYAIPFGAPAVGDLDVLCVCSDALVSTPAGFTLRRQEVNSQGAYVFSRKAVGGETANITISSPSGAGPFNAALQIKRFAGSDAFDVSNGAQVNAVAGAVTPTVSTGALAGTGDELVVLFGALHGLSTASTPINPVPSAGYSGTLVGALGTGGSGVAALMTYILTAGPAAQSPSVSWTNNMDDRYALVAAFTATPAATGLVAPDGLIIPVTLGAPTLSADATIVPDGLVIPVEFGAPTLLGGSRPDPMTTVVAAALDCLTEAVNYYPNPPDHICMRVGTEVAQDIDSYIDLCCEGLAYVMLGDTWPTNMFPDLDVRRQSDTACGPPAWAQSLKLGIVRCAPIASDEVGSMPTCDQWNEAGQQNIYDAAALRRATCCLRSWFHSQTGANFYGMSIVIDRQAQGPVQGGCVERAVTLQVEFPNFNCVGC